MKSPPTILVADDSHAVQVRVKRRLEQAGYNVLIAEDGQVAVEQIAASNPDAVILDINMPQLDGYGVCQQIRNMDMDMPVIFLTSVEANAVKILGDEWGAYLTKPVCGEKLIQTLGEVLGMQA